MKVQAVTFGINRINTVRNSNINSNTNVNKPLLKPSGMFTLSHDNISFTGKTSFITDQNKFRNLATNGHIGCIWCGKSMFTKDELNHIKLFSSRMAHDAKLFSSVMLRFQDYFSEDKIILIKQIGDYSNIYPEKDLRFIMTKMLPKSEKKLINRQFFVFHKLIKYKKMLPKDIQQKYDMLIQRSKDRINGKPYVSEYSAKEFYYQLCNMTKNMENPIGQKMRDCANFLNHPAFKDESSLNIGKLLVSGYKLLKINPHAKGNYISPKDANAKLKMQTLVLKQIKEYSENQKRKDILDLCNITERKLYGRPVVLKFSNKVFIYKLDEILKNEEDKNLVNAIMKLTDELPTSVNNRDAFIVKYKYSSNEALISSLLESSMVTIEHLTPILRNTSQKDLKIINSQLPKSQHIEKGENTLGNWALSCRFCNGIHGSDNIKGENFPFSVEAGRKYFETIIKDSNGGLFAGESVIKMVRNYMKQTGLEIDTRNLKYTPEPEY